MTENLFVTNRHYEDGGDFTQRYFYELRGCVAPPIKRRHEEQEQPIKKKSVRKSQREKAMDAARKKVNQRYNRK